MVAQQCECTEAGLRRKYISGRKIHQYKGVDERARYVWEKRHDLISLEGWVYARQPWLSSDSRKHAKHSSLLPSPSSPRLQLTGQEIDSWPKANQRLANSYF